MTDIHPIRNDRDHEAALREIERLWGAPESTFQGDQLDVLATLVEAYEDRRWPMDDSDPVDAIEAAMAYEGHSRADLGRLIGPSRATEVLQRKRALTLPMIRKIASAWHVPERLLVREYSLRPKVAHVRKKKVSNPATRAAMAESRNILASRRRQAHSAG
jgi:HTH-type transcriptional regulator/antitoxin HigA